mmetsp:Transcript_19581/g.40774  ORF Transcript_19581/g.40774 Transcript_19581/m.40774 type:complete len:215 (+) Transcript_19581:68-712(+)
MRRARTSCSSWTTSSASRRLALRCRRSWAASRARWATSPRWRRTWRPCRSASQPRRRAPLPPCRPCTCPQTISRTPRPPRHSRTWTPRQCCRGRSQSSASTPPWIPWTLPPACLTRPSWASATTTLPVALRRSSRTTSRCRTSSPSWAWTSSPRRTSSPSPARGRLCASSPSRSSWPRSLLARPAPSWTWRRRSPTSRRCSPAPATTSPSSLST